MIKKLVAAAAAAGATAALALSTPSFAAAAPTLAGPELRVGYGPVELSGTAAPGAVVRLYETAIVFDDLEPADDWANGGGPVAATADSSGHWRLQRILDSGFYFQVEAGGARSNKLTVRIQQSPVLTLSSTSANTVTAHVLASPAEPTLAAQVQVNLSGSTWTTIAGGTIGEDGAFDATIRGVAGGTHAFRAYVGADASNGVLAGYSAGHNVTVLGTPTNPPVTNPPTPNPPTTKPAGNVQFTRVQFKSKSLNGEWVRITNNTQATVDLKGWTVRDAANHVYTFASTYRLGKGGAVYLHTGKGANSIAHRYWGRTGYIWNDGGDTAILRNKEGKSVDTCKWGTGTGVTAC